MKKFRNIMTMVIVFTMIFSAVPSGAFAASATTPEDVYIEQAEERLQSLAEKLNGKFFTVNRESCATGDSGHGCENCDNDKVIKAGWLEEEGFIVPDDPNYMPSQYFADGSSGYPKGNGCYGFANYAHWYIFAKKPTDKVKATYIGSCAFTYDAMQALGVCPGDVLRMDDAGHSVVFISYDGTSGINALDANWRTSSDQANMRIRVNYFRFNSSEKIGVTGTENYTRVKGKKVESITVSTLGVAEIVRGESLPLKATVSPEDAGITDVEWSVESITGEATIDQNGVLTGTRAGEVRATASAKDGSGVSGSINVNILPIEPIGIEIELVKDMIRMGTTTNAVVKILPEDHDDIYATVTFESSNEKVALVDASGIVNAAGLGECTITARYGDFSDSATITVKAAKITDITVEGPAEITHRSTGTYTYTHVPPDGDDSEFYFSTSDESVLTIDQNGVATAQAPGSAKVYVIDGLDEYVFGSIDVTVVPLMTEEVIMEGPETVENLTETAYTAHSSNHASDERVHWSVTDGTGEATVDQETGVLKASKPGTVTLRADAVDGSGKFAEKTVTITPVEVSSLVIEGPEKVQKLESGQYSVIFRPETADEDISLLTWSVSDEKLASIDPTGKLVALGVGKVTVKATYKKVTATLEVTLTAVPPTDITITGNNKVIRGEKNPYKVTILPADADQNAYKFSIKPGTGDAEINDKGELTGTKAGTVTLRATSTVNPDVLAELQITIDPVKVKTVTVEGKDSLENGAEATYTVKVAPENADDKGVKWTVISNGGTASISDKGVLKATGTGEIVVRAEAKDGSGVYGEKKVTITKKGVKKIEIVPESAQVYVGRTTTFNAKALPEDADNRKINWSVSDTDIATINENGVLTAKNAGTVTVTAASADNPDVKATAEVTVLPTQVESIKLNDTKAQTGTVLSASVLPVDATGEYSWYADGIKIAGADQSTYTITFSDSGKMITARFTGTGNYGGSVLSTPSQTVQPVIDAEGPRSYTVGSGKEIVFRLTPDLEYLTSVTVYTADGGVTEYSPDKLPEGMTLSRGSTVLTISPEFADTKLGIGENSFAFTYLKDLAKYTVKLNVKKGFNPFSPDTGESGRIIIVGIVLLVALIAVILLLKNRRRHHEKDDENLEE